MSIVHDVFESVKQRDPDQPEFHQAVWEVLESLEPVLEKHPHYGDGVKRIAEPERMIQFRVSWMDDNGDLQLDFEDQIVTDTVISHDGDVPHARLREMLGLPELKKVEPEAPADNGDDNGQEEK